MKKTYIYQAIPTLFHPHPTWLFQTLKSLVQHQRTLPRNYRVSTTVYINAAPDEKSLQKICKQLKAILPTVIIESSTINKGFTGAINDLATIARYEKADWLLILNDDITITDHVYPTFCTAMNSKKYHLISGTIADPNGNIESRGLTYHTSGLAFPETNPFESHPTKYACGTVLAIDSSTIMARHKRLFGQLLQPPFFAYHEDLELSLWVNRRTRNSIKIVDEVVAIHEGSRTAKRGSAFQLYLGFKNTLATMYMYWSWPKDLKNVPAMLIGQLYFLGLSWYKGYWLLYPRVVKMLWRQRREVRFIRDRLTHV